MSMLKRNLSAVWAATPFPSLLAEWRHWLPFVAWLALMFAVQSACGKSAWGYAGMTVAGVALAVVAKPWRFYARPSWQGMPLALVVGLVVFVLWVGPETEWMRQHLPAFHAFYVQWCGFPFGTLAKAVEPSVYDPQVCGWPLALVRVAGSALVIAVIEEFFWRGWLYRRLIAREVQQVALRQWNWEAFAIMVALFGIEHDRWLAGMSAGALYGWLMLRTGSLWPPIVAHVVTNLLLGLYVLGLGKYGFW